MHFTIRIIDHVLWILLFFSFFISLSHCDPRTSIAHFHCSNYTTPDASEFPSFLEVMDHLKGSLSSAHYAEYSIENSGATVSGLAQCYADLSINDCQLCFSKARGLIPRCIPHSGGRVFLDGCFLRYDNHTIIDETSDPVEDIVTCGNNTAIVSDKFMKLEFTRKVNTVLDNVTATAPSNDGFAVADEKGVAGVYALAQCWKSLNDSACSECLQKSADKLKSCIPNSEGRAMYAGCYLRYSMNKFYGVCSETRNTEDDSKVVMIVTSVAAALALLSAIGAIVGYLRLSKSRNALSCPLPSIVSRSNLNFKYEELEDATKNFADSNKLGQGGAGSVYKGTLRDGKTVAVKRLFFNTLQWADEFFNEVNLINGIRHKNLVRLLGCSIEGPESLLVYEYVPNMNLDHFLFDKGRTRVLTWQQRADIIYGLADGLAYLHGGAGCQTKIIHRDIKASNILLDKTLTPKIADFGLARCVSADKTHISTGIAGTLGYMAPEYLIRGQLTEKADVYAFGIVALEIVCGRKNSAFTHGSASLLRTVWNHYKSNRLLETVDECLRGNFSSEVASSVLQIGLLCTQASPALRPSMARVVGMLNDDEGEIPAPKQPPFLNATLLGSDDTSTASLSEVSLPMHDTSSSFSKSPPVGHEDRP